MHKRIAQLYTLVDNMFLDILGFQVEVMTNGYVLLVHLQENNMANPKIVEKRFVFENDLELQTIVEPIIRKVESNKQGEQNNETFEHDG